MLVSDDPATAVSHLDSATRIFDELGARNELARALATRAELQRAAGDIAGARQLLERALAIFEELGTLDEPRRVHAALDALSVPGYGTMPGPGVSSRPGS